MTFLSGNRVRRTPAMRVLRGVVGCAAVALIIYALSMVPYDILRAERFRIYGESFTTGVVTAVRAEAATSEGSRFFVDYKYVDADGLVRNATARLPHEEWERYRPGERIEVLYASQRPAVSRTPGEIEPRFQLWLRAMLR
ncbi:DUF3592 domain-containing protein [Pseudodesulfovibrio pelocollis]|uniref:DUF3592 domain-containing protein n=1 Tax=Pseudodesulfovibrio pelocollis TaxID=3051432 RepID=UPI00255B221A|nr:DUF3592 domain-containing protein [Pseudodesulfovibrio sp. SB368]